MKKAIIKEKSPVMMLILTGLQFIFPLNVWIYFIFVYKESLKLLLLREKKWVGIHPNIKEP